jgi:hypothetical protein
MTAKRVSFDHVPSVRGSNPPPPPRKRNGVRFPFHIHSKDFRFPIRTETITVYNIQIITFYGSYLCIVTYI